MPSDYSLTRRLFLRKTDGTPSGPPAERALSFLIIPGTREGVKIIDERPVVTAEGGCTSGSLVYDNR